MNGAEALINTLKDCGVTVCFANPGTSEMQLVAALDQQPDMHAVLGLFEGVVTGAADGYARMADKPAATLLHLGPGFGNGIANLHNARRAFSPVINIVGDHAVDHLQYDAPLTSDLIGVVTPMSDWVRVSSSPSDLALAGAEAFKAATVYPGQIATVVAPADHAWTEGAAIALPLNLEGTPLADEVDIEAAAAVLSKDEPTAIYLGGRALREDALYQAGRIQAVTGCRLICETFTARLQRGVGRVQIERLPYFGEMAADYIKDLKGMVFVGAEPPVSFFAYPGKPSWLSPEDADLVRLASARVDALDALTRLADSLNAPEAPQALQKPMVPPYQPGPLNAANMGGVIAKLMPEDCIVSDEAATTGLGIYPMTMGAPKHDWMMVTGGAIGQGLPLALGAAMACPDRKVLALQADGSAMYTVQALWSIAREKCDVVTIIMNNGSYAILNVELKRVGVENPGDKALSLLDLTRPAIDWVSISEGMGVPAVKVSTTDELETALSDALSAGGPRLIEAIVAPPQV